MCVDFIQGFLIFSLLSLAFLIFYQNTNYTFFNSKNNSNSRSKENYFPIIEDQCPFRNTHSCKCGVCKCSQCLSKGNRCGCMGNQMIALGQPVHPVGPVINFHQRFRPFMPELTWRGLYIQRYNKTLPVKDSSFDGTPVRNFLDQLENVDNIYRKC